MGKELSEMTLEELWELFPIFLIEPDEKWVGYYDEIASFLQKALNDYSIERISHIGSTAIKGIWAKDIVDVLIEIPYNQDIEAAAHTMERNGFIRMSTEKSRISFNKGYTKDGFADKVYHAHLRYVGDNDELYFRDYLNEHPQIAKEYETLKWDCGKSTSITEMLIRMRKQALFASGQQKPANFMVIDTDNYYKSETRKSNNAMIKNE